MNNGSLYALKKTSTQTVEDRAWNRLIDEVAKRTPLGGKGIGIEQSMSGSVISPFTQAGPGIARARAPFTVYADTGLDVKVSGGTVYWHDLDLTMADSAAATVPANSTGFCIWIDLVAEFAPTAPVFGNGASFPAQPDPPARRYFLLGEVDTDATSITKIVPSWSGGDIIWPAPFGFWK